jgi:hypothetical protein
MSSIITVHIGWGFLVRVHTNIKIIDTIQGHIHKYQNLKRITYNCNSSIYFNKQCLRKGLTPNYAKIKIPRTSTAAIYTQQKVSRTRIRDELKHLYIKKQQLNQETMKLQLLLADHWDRMWPHIQHAIEAKLKHSVHKKYETLKAKLATLAKEQTKTPHKSHVFFPRLANNTDIKFSERESPFY